MLGRMAMMSLLDDNRRREHKARNQLQSALLVGGLVKEAGTVYQGDWVNLVVTSRENAESVVLL